MKAFLTLLCLTQALTTFAQDAEDVLKYAFYPQAGTARNVAIGGANGSLGGDISSIFINPAGLGLYKTNEFVCTPGMGFNSNQNNFRGTDASSSLSKFQLGTCGFVFGSATNDGTKWTGHAVGVAITKIADFNNHNYYQGLNTYSSYADQYAEQANGSGESVNGILNDPQYAFGTALAVDTYLVDTFTTSSGLQYLGLPDFLLGKNIPLLQQKTMDSHGGLSELAGGIGVDYNEQWYFGGTMGIPIVYLNQTTTFTESASSPDPQNQFVSSQLIENRITKGYGVYLRLGAIYKPVSNVRIGASVTTPSYITLTDTRSANMTTNTGSYAGKQYASSDIFAGGGAVSNDYSIVTPWRALLSGSYLFNAVEDVHQQRGFITADLEYVGYHVAAFHGEDTGIVAGPGYYSSMTTIIRDRYKGALNVKVGGELKLNILMVRAGFAHYGNPYRDATDLKAAKTVLSAGIGYRNRGIFVDLTYAYSIEKDVDFPYLLAMKDNTFAHLRNNRGSLMATIGFKF
jgi:hypothetical protein